VTQPAALDAQLAVVPLETWYRKYKTKKGESMRDVTDVDEGQVAVVTMEKLWDLHF
jgi:hypothetical protein